ncbi:MAG: hypothetical protein L6Q77_15400 [Bacteroidetes bacterium]|nr:hypothetical protein [Bacteroidota bacterium]
MKYQNIREEELKNKIAKDYFWLYDCTKIIGNVDFCVCFHQSQPELFEREFLLWAEAKTGSSDIYKSIVQLILTIGKARTFDKFLPPAMLGAFDFEKIAFIHYNDIHEVFYQNDFNWNVTPSDHDSKEFKLLLEKVKKMIDSKALLFTYLRDDRELTSFIKKNFVVGKFGLTKTRIDKNNFMVIYNKWLQIVKPTIAVNWDAAKRNGIIDGDFYLADLLSHENTTLKEKLFVLLHLDHYELDRRIDEAGMFSSKRTDFKDGQVAHTQFWNKYERPPKEEYWDYIVERRDLLVPQDVRERKGSFFTPQIWVELSQKYLTDVLGEDWQDEYTVWDCAAGTGNLLAGLTNKYNIWASTLDRQDVEVMHDRIKNGANLLDDHVFQFDFLNDDFSKLPAPLQAIITDPKKRKKLVIYINPPYKRGLGVANTNWHIAEMGEAKDELYIQFLYRIKSEISGCKLGVFSKLKLLNAPDFETMRQVFQVKLETLFVMPANTFDNVNGKFPIGFQIYDLGKKEVFNSINSDVYDEDRNFIGTKLFSTYNNSVFLNKWLGTYKDNSHPIGKLIYNSNDFQHQNRIRITNFETIVLGGDGKFKITKSNLLVACVYLTIRHCIEATWLNDRDQFLQPNKNWEHDMNFQSNCLIYSLFHTQNNISTRDSTNHWIPFTEQEVNAREKFESNYMSRFILGKLRKEAQEGLFSEQEERTAPLVFSPEATAVLDSGRELWKYYHQQPNCNVNASLYDIREYFQGRNETGKMNSKSGDEQYMSLIGNLRGNLKLLAAKIEPKVYEYGFLRK